MKILKLLFIIFLTPILICVYAEKKVLPYPSGGSLTPIYTTTLRSGDYNKYFDDYVVNGIFRYYDENEFEIRVDGSHSIFEKARRNTITMTFVNLPGKQPLIDKFTNQKLLLTRILPTGMIVLVCLFLFDKIKK